MIACPGSMGRSFAPAIGAVAALALLTLTPALAQRPAATASARGDILAALTDTAFWRLFTTMSEPDGTFASENLTSNERSFTSVIPTLLRTASPGGAYLGVGPEQNFTYIANLRPAMAIILDIRRQNALLHLMYKALFELSPTRAEFVGRLFGRRLPGALKPQATVDELLSAAAATERSDAFRAQTLDTILTVLTSVSGHGFALSVGDRADIQHVYQAFAVGGPNIHYGYSSLSGSEAVPSNTYPGFNSIQTSANEDGARLTFLATEALYQEVRDLERRNLIVPVVGDFAGPKALRAIGDYLASQHATVSVFYVSNVEEYLLPTGGSVNPVHGEEFYRNLQALPLDSSSMFIRSARPTMTPGVAASRLPPGAPYSSTRFDSAGRRWTRVVTGGGGGTQIATTADAGVSGSSPLTSKVEMTQTGLPTALTFSGLASIPATISAFTIAGGINYRDLLALTYFFPR